MASDFPKNSEQIPGGAELLRAAYATTQAAVLPEEFRMAAFEGMLQLALRDAPGPVRAVAGPTPAVAASRAAQATDGGRLPALAAKLGLPLEQASEVFYEEDEQLLLGVAASRFGTKKSEAARRIGLLVTLARQFDGQEQWTPVAVLREACQEYNAFDVSNFAKHILGLDDVLQFQGSGAQRKVRLTRPGLEAGAEVIRELTV